MDVRTPRAIQVCTSPTPATPHLATPPAHPSPAPPVPCSLLIRTTPRFDVLSTQTSIDYLLQDLVNWTGPFFPEDAPLTPPDAATAAANYVAVYDFLRDRLRAIASDINLQHIRDELCVYVHERIARFFIFVGCVYACAPTPAPPRATETIVPASPE